MQENSSTTKADSRQVVNLAAFIPELAARQPDKPAIVFPRGRGPRGRARYAKLTFREFEEQMNAYARGFLAVGVTRGMRVSFMVRPKLEFLPLLFAMYKIGAVPVLIDPGIGKQNLLECVRAARPRAFVGIPRAQVARLLFPKYFKSVRITVTIGKKWFWGGHSLKDLYVADGDAPDCTTTAEDPAAIIFTTGSTGPPKGVVYTHGMFVAQRKLLREIFGITENDVDMPTFALFSMYTLPMGCTLVIPDMDQTRPATVDPRRIIEAVESNGVTFSFGSPALWNTVSLYCLKHGVEFASLKKVLMAGAPIPAYLHERMLGHILGQDGEVYTPYGATECLPVTSFRGSAALGETAKLTAKGKGYCVGSPLPGITVKIIKISDEPIRFWREVKELPAGEIGEITVQGPVVSREYFELPEQTVLHKVYETDGPDGPFWHRTGDLGRVDEQGRLWLCGRKAHRVETGSQTLFTVCCEAIFNEHRDVFRSALVGLGEYRYGQKPVIIIEPQPGKHPWDAQIELFKNELLVLAQAHEITRPIETVLFHEAFPVDVRHNAKIFREKLAAWAAEEAD